MTTEHKKQKPNKKIILNAFLMGCSGLQSPGLWKAEGDESSDFDKPEYWVKIAQILEKGKFSAIFLADVLGGYDVYKGPHNIEAAAKAGSQWPILETSVIVPLMASVTKNISFGLTFSTISENPYHFARRLGSLDHYTHGRIGWNIVTSYLESAARNLLNGGNLPPRNERYELAGEYLQVVEELLLSSWRDDSVELNKSTKVYSNPEKIREINFNGKYFQIPGPSTTHPSPQRLPVLLQAGTSSQGKEFAAKNAEVVFITNFTPEVLKKNIEEIKSIAVDKYGREEDSIKFLQLITPILDKTDDLAKEKFSKLSESGDLEGAQALFGGWTGIDLSKFKYEDDLTEPNEIISSGNAVKGFIDNWTKKCEGEDENLVKSREYVAQQITIGGLGPVFIGSGDTVADEIQKWVEISGVDGFNVTYATSPGTFEDVVEYLIPVLQERDLFWKDYPESKTGKPLTFRENVFGVEDKFNPEDPTFVRPSHPAHNLRWKSSQTKTEFEQALKQYTK